MPRRPLPVGSWGRIARSQANNGRWVARARFRDADGRTRQVEAWGKSGAAAERALIVALKDRATSIGTDLTPDSRMTAVSDLWLRTKVDGSDLSSNTQQRYREVVANYVDPGIGGLLVREATVPALDRFLKAVTDSHGPATARLCRTVLNGMMKLAVLHKATTTNTARDTEVIPVESKEVRALSVDEVKALRAVLREDVKAKRADLPALVDIMLATGARVGEVLALRWSDVDLTAGTVRITGTVVRVRGDGLTRQDTTKGRKVRAHVLPQFALTLLMDRSVNGLPGGPWDVVFPTAKGGLREVTTVEAQWRRFRERHPAFKWVTPHTFRKTVGTHLDRAGGAKSAAAQLGHSDTTITTRHYIATPDLAPDVSAVLEQLGE